MLHHSIHLNHSMIGYYQRSRLEHSHESYVRTRQQRADGMRRFSRAHASFLLHITNPLMLMPMILLCCLHLPRVPYVPLSLAPRAFPFHTLRGLLQMISADYLRRNPQESPESPLIRKDRVSAYNRLLTYNTPVTALKNSPDTQALTQYACSRPRHRSSSSFISSSGSSVPDSSSPYVCRKKIAAPCRTTCEFSQ